MSALQQLYPIGTQTFSHIREDGGIYIDKTDLVYEMANDLIYIAFARPSRFGKTVLLTTLQAYFEGRKELFKGLAIEKLEKDWIEYPVLKFSMGCSKHMDPEHLEYFLLNLIEGYEKKYGITNDCPLPGLRLSHLVEHIHKTTGKEVVVLVDDYDAPLLNLDNEGLPKLRNIIHSFYAPLKELDWCLRFVFLAGRSRFRMADMLSGGFNNVTDVSLRKKYATICGITEEELLTQLRPGIEELAEAMEVSCDEAVRLLRKRYNGYRFAPNAPNVYNPRSLFSALCDHKLDPFWFEWGTPPVLTETLEKYNVLPQKIGGIWSEKDFFFAFMDSIYSATPLLFQNGYITIKDYNREYDECLLDIPNSEMREGIMYSYLPKYFTYQFSSKAHGDASDIDVYLDDGDLDKALTTLRDILAIMPNTDEAKDKSHYQAVLYVLLSIASAYWIDMELRTPEWGVDIVVYTHHTTYLMAFMFDGTPSEALSLIDPSAYGDRLQQTDKPIVKVGAVFNTNSHTLTDWEIATPED